MKALLLVLLLLSSVPVLAQEPVAPVPDWASYVTAGVNPGIAVWQAARADQPKCRLGQLAISEGLANGIAFTAQHFIVSPRPCLGCPPHGMPSAHVANSTVGFSARDWRVGLWFTLGTAELRTSAHRHTPLQVAAGAALGLVSEWAGHSLLHCP